MPSSAQPYRIARYRFVEGWKSLVLRSTGGCHDCGWESDQYFCYDFDHCNDDKEAAVSQLCADCRPYSEIMREMLKCDLVCANCHRIRTHRRYHEKG